MTPPPQPELFLSVKPSEIAILMSYSKTIAEKAEILQIIDARPYQPERDVKELFRKEIAKWKEEDPLFMAYVYGQEAGRKEGCDKKEDQLADVSNIKRGKRVGEP
jgi:hypothetical protein